MKRFVLILSVICGMLPFTAISSIQQSIDRSDIHAGETFVLTIRVENASDEEPDLSVIPKELTIEGTTQYQNTQIFNGQTTSIRGWKIKLKAVEPGRIVIPPMDVAGEQTKPIQLNILKSSDSVTIDGRKKAIFITSTVDNKSVWVQQQVVLTIKLYRSVNAYYASLTSPWAEDTIVEKLGDDQQTEQHIDGRRYLVTVRKFALFPQKSGEIDISPINFTANVNVGSRRNFNNYLNGERPIAISTDKIRINVKPRPANWQGEWLPASDLSLQETWDPADLSLTAGQPSTWTIKLSAQGLSEDQLPNIQLPASQGLQFYADSPQKERDTDAAGIVGQRIQKFAVIPAKAGTFEIPAVTIRWWDTVNNKPKTAEIPARKVVVAAGKLTPQSQQTTPVTPSSGVTKPRPVSPQTNESLSPTAEEKDFAALTTTIARWQLISGLLAAGWLLTVFLLLRGRATRVHQPETNASAKRTAVEKNLREALKQQDAAKICQYLPQWVSQSLHQPFHSVGAIRRQISEPALVEKLSQLESLAFSATPQSHENSAATSPLEQADLPALLNAIREQSKPARATPLHELYS